jgi:hypothetical protein
VLGLLLAVVLAVLGLLIAAGPAAAHDVLIGSDPSDGVSVAAAPPQVVLRFNSNPQPGFATVAVIGPDGSAWQAGEPLVAGSDVTVALHPLGPAGRYEVQYRVVSSDGHPVQGIVGFTLTQPGTGTATPPPSAGAGPGAAPAGGGGGAPVWPWIAGAVVLVAAGVVLALRFGR